MNLFRKRPPDDVPWWATNMNSADFDRFMKLVEKSIRKHNIVPIIHREEGYWSPADNPKHEHGLHNLVQICAPVVPLQWPEIIDNFMNVTLSVDPKKLPTDFESVKDKIKLRLLTATSRLNIEVATYPVCDEFLTVVAIDNPQSITIPKAEAVAEWPLTKSQLYDLALQNMWEQDMPSINAFDPSVPHILEFAGESFFTASHILMLDRHFPKAEHGLLVVVPARDIVFVHQIENLKTVEAVGIMIRAANELFHQSPGPVTPALLWWRDGKFINLPWEPVGNNLNFSPPPEFTDVLNSFSE